MGDWIFKIIQFVSTQAINDIIIDFPQTVVPDKSTRLEEQRCAQSQSFSKIAPKTSYWNPSLSFRRKMFVFKHNCRLIVRIYCKNSNLLVLTPISKILDKVLCIIVASLFIRGQLFVTYPLFQPQSVHAYSFNLLQSVFRSHDDAARRDVGCGLQISAHRRSIHMGRMVGGGGEFPKLLLIMSAINNGVGYRLAGEARRIGRWN